MTRRRFTKEENNLIAHLYEGGMKPAVVAANTGFNVETIKLKIKQWGIGGRYRRKFVDEAEVAYDRIDKRLPREDQFAEMLAQGFPVKRIGEVMGYKDYSSANAAFQRIRRHVGVQAR